MKGFSAFFIDRPIFATVVSIVIILLGVIGYSRLPITQYPDVVPPTIAIETAFPGASPEVLVENVVTPLEQEVNGVENMIYMTSRSNPDGTVSIEISFELGTDINTAQVLVQNRVESAKSRLPEEVRNIGVRVTKRSPSLLLGIALFSPDGSRDTLYMTNYYLTQMRDRILRVAGVGDVVVYGAREYSMRVWLDPDKLARLNLSPLNIVAALREQNRQVAAGKLNQSPTPADAGAYELMITAKGRMESEEEFGEIIIKRDGEGGVVKLKDVARIELGAYSYSDAAFYKGKDGVSFLVYQTPGSNASNTAADVLKLFSEMKKDFPAGLDYIVGMDNTVYIAESIKAVYRTIFEALILVVVVMMLFLQNWKAAIIPIFAIPVSLIGTFFFMQIFGFSINNLTLFGLVLAIGIVVDDAIVVVENVERNMRESGLDARSATKKAMEQVQGAVVAIVLVLTSVFVPTAFVTGITGEFYRQFALTIAASTFISGLVSLTLTPAICAILMKHSSRPDFFSRIWNFVFGKFFALFNKGFFALSTAYGKFVRATLKISLLLLILYALQLAATAYLFKQTPKGFIPPQDTCYFYIAAKLPDGATLERSAAVLQKAAKIIKRVLPEAKNSMELVGLNVASLSRSSNSGTIFIELDTKEERTKAGKPLDSSIATLMSALYKEIPEATMFAIKPPVVSGIGFGGDFKCFVQDRNSVGLAAVEKNVKVLAAEASKTEPIQNAFTMFTISNPELFLDVDREQCERLGISIGSVFDALRFNLGSAYINDFNILNRAYRVVIQSEGAKRTDIDDIYKLKIPVYGGENVEIGSVAEVKRIVGPEVITRYNLYPAAEIVGNLNIGYSTGQALAEIEKLADANLADGLGIEWTDLAFQEKRASDTAMIVFALCVIFVFLVLAAMYESWGLPMSVILIVPLVLLFSILGVIFEGGDINIMTQIGFIVLIGLACKNAILIVEFAKQRQERGEGVVEAVSTAAANRLRPILMTSFAFILGVAPLVFTRGTGSELRNALGIPVFYGMIGVTLVGLLFTPIFFYLIRKNFKAKIKN